MSKEKISEDKRQAIENVKESLRRNQLKLNELSKRNGPYHFDPSPDRDQYNFVHGMVYAHRELLYCFGLSSAEVDAIIAPAHLGK